MKGGGGGDRVGRLRCDIGAIMMPHSGNMLAEVNVGVGGAVTDCAMVGELDRVSPSPARLGYDEVCAAADKNADIGDWDLGGETDSGLAEPCLLIIAFKPIDLSSEALLEVGNDFKRESSVKDIDAAVALALKNHGLEYMVPAAQVVRSGSM
jgi:hypothetical protein